MICRVCGRGACTESFHSLAEQEEMDRLREGRLSPAEKAELDADDDADCAGQEPALGDRHGVTTPEGASVSPPLSTHTKGVTR